MIVGRLVSRQFLVYRLNFWKAYVRKRRPSCKSCSCSSSLRKKGRKVNLEVIMTQKHKDVLTNVCIRTRRPSIINFEDYLPQYVVFLITHRSNAQHVSLSNCCLAIISRSENLYTISTLSRSLKEFVRVNPIVFYNILKSAIIEQFNRFYIGHIFREWARNFGPNFCL